MNRMYAYLKKDGWILAALLFCVILCLMLGADADGSNAGENHISRVLSTIQGAGKVEVAIYYKDTVPCGAVVVADGADDIAVQLRLLSAVTTLLGIQQDRVSIYEREGR